MKTRAVYIEEGLTLSDAGVETIDIKTGAPLSALELTFGGTKGATENQSDKIQDVITGIELRDGSEILWSLSMQQAVALNCFELKRKPAHYYQLSGGGSPVETCWLFFGRKLFDPEYYLRPGDYKNLQLRITTNLSAGAGTYVSGSLSVDVMAHVIDEGAGSYQGFLSAKEVYSWTTTGSGDETVDMPVEYPYVRALVGALEDGVAPSTDITDAKLTADADKFIIFDYNTSDWLYRNLSEFGAFLEFLQSTLQDADTLNASLFDIKGVNLIGGDEDHTARCEGVAGNTMTVAMGAQT